MCVVCVGHVLYCIAICIRLGGPVPKFGNTFTALKLVQKSMQSACSHCKNVHFNLAGLIIIVMDLHCLILM